MCSFKKKNGEKKGTWRTEIWCSKNYPLKDGLQLLTFFFTDSCMYKKCFLKKLPITYCKNIHWNYQIACFVQTAVQNLEGIQFIKIYNWDSRRPYI